MMTHTASHVTAEVLLLVLQLTFAAPYLALFVPSGAIVAIFQVFIQLMLVMIDLAFLVLDLLTIFVHVLP